ncbi:MAG: flagellar basal body L-ring protein FlgH [Planctomycetota bacterium]
MNAAHAKVITTIATAFITAVAGAQSLYSPGNVGIPVNSRGEPEPAASLVGYSMIVITPPPPREIQRHDLITIIVNQTSQSRREQTLETEKEYNAEARLAQFLQLNRLLELRLDSGPLNTDDLLDIRANSEFEGEGTYERRDRLTTRVQAEVIDVKPNGNLVLEARTRMQTDEEVQEFVLSGVARTEDITLQNTVQSTQLHNLTINVRNEGEVRKSAKKGFIPRALEAIFAF